MKLLKVSSALLLATAVLFTACKSKSPKELIVKKWKIKELAGKEFEGMPDSVSSKIYANATMEFKNDGKYENAGMGDGIKTGTYSLSTDGKNLYTTDEGSTFTDSLQILEITADKLIVTDKKGDIKVTFGVK